VAPHTLLSISDSVAGIVERETLDLRIFFDVSVLEIFVNNRVAITTRVYPDSGKCFGVDAWTGREEPAKVARCMMWKLGMGVKQK
jgi:beta-fructofuranosidase